MSIEKNEDKIKAYNEKVEKLETLAKELGFTKCLGHLYTEDGDSFDFEWGGINIQNRIGVGEGFKERALMQLRKAFR